MNISIEIRNARLNSFPKILLLAIIPKFFAIYCVTLYSHATSNPVVVPRLLLLNKVKIPFHACRWGRRQWSLEVTGEVEEIQRHWENTGSTVPCGTLSWRGTLGEGLMGSGGSWKRFRKKIGWKMRSGIVGISVKKFLLLMSLALHSFLFYSTLLKFHQAVLHLTRCGIPKISKTQILVNWAKEGLSLLRGQLLLSSWCTRNFSWPNLNIFF